MKVKFMVPMILGALMSSSTFAANLCAPAYEVEFAACESYGSMIGTIEKEKEFKVNSGACDPNQVEINALCSEYQRGELARTYQNAKTSVISSRVDGFAGLCQGTRAKRDVYCTYSIEAPKYAKRSSEICQVNAISEISGCFSQANAAVALDLEVIQKCLTGFSTVATPSELWKNSFCLRDARAHMKGLSYNQTDADEAMLRKIDRKIAQLKVYLQDPGVQADVPSARALLIELSKIDLSK